MKRNNKIKLLCDLKNGKIDIDIFKPHKFYVFTRHKNEIYDIDGNNVSVDKFNEIKKNVEIRNNHIKQYEMENIIQKSEWIELVFKEGKTIL